jgi:hypothetical protein
MVCTQNKQACRACAAVQAFHNLHQLLFFLASYNNSTFSLDICEVPQICRVTAQQLLDLGGSRIGLYHHKVHEYIASSCFGRCVASNSTFGTRAAGHVSLLVDR